MIVHAGYLSVRCARAVISLQKNMYLVLSIVFVTVSVGIVIASSLSYYEFKYGRDLIFTGISKHLLSFATFCLAAGCYLLHRARNRQYELLVESNKHLVAFTISAIGFIAAYVFESGLI